MERSGRFAAWAAPGSAQAFTLVESLFAVGLIVLLAAVSFPMLDSTIQGYRVRTAAWQVAGHLRLTRAKAVSTNRTHRVCLRKCSAAVPDNGYLIERSVGPSEWAVDTIVEAPSEQVQVTPDKSTTSISFGGGGGTDGGTVTLRSGSRTFQVRTHYTGRVRVCKDACS